jgi:hypothetical protein
MQSKQTMENIKSGGKVEQRSNVDDRTGQN